MNPIIKIAKYRPTQEALHVDNALNGLACDCICYGCGQMLSAIQGEKKEFHYRHNIDSDCKGALESALHQLAKKIIVDNTSINLPEQGAIIYSNPISEKAIDTFRPDVKATYIDEVICFEIIVTNRVSKEKEKYFKDNHYKSIEINLIGCESLSSVEIENLVLKETKNKKIIFWDVYAEKMYKIFGRVILVIISLGLFYYITKAIFKKKR